MSRILGSAPAPVTNPLFTNLPALQYGISQLNVPGVVTMVGLVTDSMIAGTQASDINTAAVTRFRVKFLDKVNAKIGGSAKSGRGRFGPFHHAASGVVTGTSGPIIIGASSGWVKTAAYFYQRMFGETLDHPGSITPAVGTSYCGVYMAMSQVGLVGNAAKWLGMLIGSASTGSIRVQFRQGASVVQTGTTGTNRYLINGGVPDPAVGGGDIKVDVTLDFATASYPDMEAWITGHLNSTGMDPTAVWQLVIYRPNNSATNVTIHGFDAHYDEYSAQNTPSIYGAVCVMDCTRPGTTMELLLGGDSTYGTNSDWEAQSVQNSHINVHTKAYNKSAKFTHTMPLLKLLVSNFWRNDLNQVEGIVSMSPTIQTERMTKAILACAKAGVALLQLCDIGASASSVCSGPHFSGTGQTYTDAMATAFSTCAGYAMTKGTAGGGTMFRLDLAAGTGGPATYVERSLHSTGDNLHWNDAGAEWVSDILVMLLTGPTSIQPYSTVATTINYQPLSITDRLGISKTTLFELDPNKLGSIRLASSTGFYPCKKQHTDFGSILTGIGTPPGDGTGISAYQLGQSKTGGATTIIYNLDQFNDRAGLQFDNEASGNSRIQFDISGLGISETQFTLFTIIQNTRATDISTAPGTTWTYWMFGTAADAAVNSTTGVFDTFSNTRIMGFAHQGANGGAMGIRVGDQIPTTIIGPATSPQPSHDPLLMCYTVDTVTRTFRQLANPTQLTNTGWQSSTAGAASLASPWAPTRYTIGGPLGTGAGNCGACAWGGTWLIRGIVTDAEYRTIWNALYAESGGVFQSGTGFSNYGAAGVIRA